MIYNFALRAWCTRKRYPHTRLHAKKIFERDAHAVFLFRTTRGVFARAHHSIVFNLSLSLSMRFIVKTEEKKKLIFSREFPLKKKQNLGRSSLLFFHHFLEE